MKDLTLIILFLPFLCLAQDEWPPIQEPWRCLEEGSEIIPGKWTTQDVLKVLQPNESPDCPEVTADICKEPIRYPVPCK